jgi:hypothetical protein
MQAIRGTAAIVGMALLCATAASADNSRSDAAPLVKAPATPGSPLGGVPANDDCANAIPITSIPFTSTVDNTAATLEAGEPPSVCTNTGATIWYSYTNSSPNIQTVNMNTWASAPMDTVLETFTGTCGALVPLGCNDDSGGGGDGFQSVLSFDVDPGQTILIRGGGFAGDTGLFTLDVTQVTEVTCADTVFNGVLGSAPVTGDQTGRLNRNGISSTCDAPKTCNIFDPAGARPFDSYSITNESDADQCVTVTLDVLDQTVCNLQSNAYLGSYDPANICTNYLADPGLSSGSPPTPTVFSFVQPVGTDVAIVVHSTNVGEGLGCNYTLTVRANLCEDTSVLEIPAADHRGLIALSVLLAGAALFVILRRRRPA